MSFNVLNMLNSFYLILFSFAYIAWANEECEPVNREDPAKFQLETFKQCVKVPVGYITTSSGQPVDIRDTNTLNTNLLLNNFFLDTLSHSISERIPERVVHAKGTGAHGYFEVTHDISDICSADVFNGIGKKTPLTARFSLATREKGGGDTVRDLRGFGLKLYTKEGNLDLLSISLPVYLYKDPVMFPHILHAVKRNPSTNLYDMTSFWDIMIKRPETLHQILWFFSDYGIPNTYRHMSTFPVHTFEVVNKQGEQFYIRFNFTTNQGIENIGNEDALRIGSADPDYFMRDLYNAIANKNYPSWTVYIDVLTKKDLEHLDFDPFDVTRVWKKGTYKQLPVGRFVLNKNPKNNFAEIEQLALNPGNLVPGILGPPDKLFEGRVIAYGNTHNFRLGFNHNNIYVNQPNYDKTYNRDGRPPVEENMKDIPNYYPNSFNGPVPVVDRTRPKKNIEILESSAVDLGPPAEFYTEVLNAAQRRRLVTNIATSLAMAIPSVQKRAVNLFNKINPELGRGVSLALLNASPAPPRPNQIIYN